MAEYAQEGGINRREPVRITTTTKVVLPHDLTVSQLQDILAQIPGDGRVSIAHHAGTDQRDPSYNTLTVNH